MVENSGLLQRLNQGVVLCAEGYVFELERRGFIQAGAYVPEVVLDHPEAVTGLHREFLRAGSDVMLALTYYAHREKLRTIGREGDLEEMNRQAVRIAREVAAEGDALVAGNISNTWVYDHRDPETTSQLVRKQYGEQVRWAAEEGVDFIIAETLDYVGEALIALEVIKAFDLPAVINFGSVHDTLKDGYGFVDACKRLEGHGADVVGLNCSRGPATMLPLIEQIRASVGGHVAALPVAYRTTPEESSFTALKDQDGSRAFPIGLDPFQATRFDLASFAHRAQESGVSLLGVCCGGAPHHVRAMAEALGRTVPGSRYSPDISLHPALGSNVSERDRPYLMDWKD